MSKHTALYCWSRVPHQACMPDLGTKSDEDMRRAADSRVWPNVDCWKWAVVGPYEGVLLKNSKASLGGVILPVCTTQEEATTMAEAGEIDTFYVTESFVTPVDPRFTAAEDACEELLQWHYAQENK